MKTLITLLLLTSLTTQGQKWFTVSKNDLWVMGLEVGAGYSQGWREEVLYHPHQLFNRFPDLNRKFWDARWSWQNGDAYKWDANHVLKGTTNAFHLAAICVKVGDLKSYPKKDRWKKVLFDAAKYYLSYQLGFALSYNLTHSNKIF
jgi:hypothetical protein